MAESKKLKKLIYKKNNYSLITLQNKIYFVTFVLWILYNRNKFIFNLLIKQNFMSNKKTNETNSLTTTNQSELNQVSDMGGISDMFGKFSEIMNKINDPNLSEDEAENIFSSALGDIQKMNEKFKNNIENSMSGILNNKDVPEDLKNMLSGVKNNLDQTINKMNSQDENLDPEDLKETSEKLMQTLQNLMKQTLPESSNQSSNDDSSDIKSMLKEMNKDLKEIKKDLERIDGQMGVHEKIIKHLSKK